MAAGGAEARLASACRDFIAANAKGGNQAAVSAAQTLLGKLGSGDKQQPPTPGQQAQARAGGPGGAAGRAPFGGKGAKPFGR